MVETKELRRTLDIDVGDALEVFTEGEHIVLKKYELGCVFCGQADNMTWHKGKNICKPCINEMKTK